MKASSGIVSHFETTRKVAELERIICELSNTASTLERQIESEEARTRICDPAHFAYSAFARSARERRDRLRATIQRLRVELSASRREWDEISKQSTRSDTHPVKGSPSSSARMGSWRRSG
jgi:flagellar protein FliJ